MIMELYAHDEIKCFKATTALNNFRNVNRVSCDSSHGLVQAVADNFNVIII